MNIILAKYLVTSGYSEIKIADKIDSSDQLHNSSPYLINLNDYLGFS